MFGVLISDGSIVHVETMTEDGSEVYFYKLNRGTRSGLFWVWWYEIILIGGEE